MKLDARDGRDGLPEGFTELAKLVYGDDPLWIPEDPNALRAAFSATSPWFRTGEARAFVVPGAVRVAAFLPATPIGDERAAFFGFFESTGDAAAVKRAFAAAFAWARERGATRVYGPIQFSTAHGYRLRVEGPEDGRPLDGEPYNPPRYHAELRALGLEVVERYLTQRMEASTGASLLARLERPASWSEAAGYRVETLTPDLWMASLDELHAVVEATFRDNFGYTPMGLDAFRAGFGAPLAKKLDPRASKLARAKDGTIVGFCLVYPDYAALLAQGAGARRVTPAELRCDVHGAMLDELGERDWILKTIGVLPKHRRFFVGPLLTYKASLHAVEGGRRMFGALIREDNGSRRLTAEVSGERWFVLYGKSLETLSADGAGGSS